MRAFSFQLGENVVYTIRVFEKGRLFWNEGVSVMPT